MKYIQPLNDPAESPYVNGNKTEGQQGSIIPAQAIEHPMREITHLIKQAQSQEEGKAPAKMGGKIGEPSSANLTQLYHAIRKLCAPAGQTMAWSGSIDNVPDGFLVCDGQAISRTIYADLYAVLGTMHGTGDGATTFHLPNLQDKFVLGRSGSKETGTSGGAFSKNISGNINGHTNNHTLSIAQMPSHDHRLYSTNGGNSNVHGFGDTSYPATVGGVPNYQGTKGWYSINAGGNNLMENTGGNQGHRHGVNINFNVNNIDVTNPYYALIYMIRT